MQEYYFLFGVCFIYTIFATIQDLKTREISNWLNFSLVAIALSYRAFFSAVNKNVYFFIWGLAGFSLFFVLAYLFYYTKTFAGGDAKLLMAYGAILPFENFKTLLSISLLFLFLLFFIGVCYSLIYSIFIVRKNKNQFQEETKKIFQSYRRILLISSSIFLILFFSSYFYALLLFFSFIFLIPWIYVYTKGLDKCLLKLYSPEKLTEGDWLEKDIIINSKIKIKKTVHGLSLEDIKLLRKYKKKVLIKEGIPFTPAFLFALIIMALVFSKELPLLQNLLSFLQFLP